MSDETKPDRWGNPDECEAYWQQRHAADVAALRTALAAAEYALAEQTECAADALATAEARIGALTVELNDQIDMKEANHARAAAAEAENVRWATYGGQIEVERARAEAAETRAEAAEEAEETLRALHVQATSERDEAKRMWDEWRGLCFKAQENAEAAETRAKDAEAKVWKLENEWVSGKSFDCVDAALARATVALWAEEVARRALSTIKENK